MADEIRKDGVLYAIVHRKDDWQDGLNFITPNEMSIQVGTFWYQKGQECKAHRHILNERDNGFTQECNIVLVGSVRVDLYDDYNRVFHSEILKGGDLMVMIAGGHGFEIIDPDTKIIECKNGPFISVEKDKRAIEPLLCSHGGHHD